MFFSLFFEAMQLHEGGFGQIKDVGPVLVLRKKHTPSFFNMSIWVSYNLLFGAQFSVQLEGCINLSVNYNLYFPT